MRSIARDEKALVRAFARRQAERVDWVGVGRPLRAYLSQWLGGRQPTTVLVYFALGHEPSVEELLVEPGLADHR